MHVDHQITNNLLAGFTSSCTRCAWWPTQAARDDTRCRCRAYGHVRAARPQKHITRPPAPGACTLCMRRLAPAPACMHTHARTNEPNGFLFLLSLLDEQARKQPASDAGTPLRPTNTHARIGRDDDTGLCLDTTRATHQNRQLNFYGVCGGIVVFVHNCEPDVNIR